MMYEREWERFTQAVYQRLCEGERIYGNNSVSKGGEHLIDELQAECQDLAGWGMLLWLRLEQMRDTVAKLERQHEDDGC